MARSKVIARKRTKASGQQTLLTVEDGELIDLAVEINAAADKARDAFYEFIEAIVPPLRRAHAIHSNRGNGEWGKWLEQSTSLDRAAAHRLMSIDERRKFVVNSQQYLPSNEGQWQALEGVPDDKLAEVLEQAAAQPKVTAKVLKEVAAPYKPPKQEPEFDRDRTFDSLEEMLRNRMEKIPPEYRVDAANILKCVLQEYSK